MLGNQNNPDGNRLRIYGQNERASSSSSGPKWTSSITDLLVNRSNTMRFNQPQSHQTSQQQLLAQTHGQQNNQSQPTSMHNLHAGAAAGKGHQSSEGGRLMMKLMNLGAQQQVMQNSHHQPSASNMSGIGLGVAPSSSTFDHPRLSGSRDDQKRLALDECTNYLQQKTMQQHFPSTSMAISNIINSNRSASSAGIPGGVGAPSSTQASAAAKKFQAFKFNLTMNKQKALSGAVEAGPSYSSNAFYQAQLQNDMQNQDGVTTEDLEAMVLNEKQKKNMPNLSRGSSQLAMKQHLKQMIKSYEDQPPVPNNVTQDGGDRFQYNETQGIPSQNQDHQHLTYDHSVRKGSAALHGAGGTLQPASAKYTGSASSSSKNKPLDRKVHEMEERQKIFEEEIIKRVKEIQSYAKTLHMHLKKIQQTSNKRNEDLQILKEELVQQIKDCNDLISTTNNSRQQSHFNESAIHDLLEKRLKLVDSEFALQIEHLEQKLVKDYDGKISRQARTTSNEWQTKSDTLKDEILNIMTSEFSNNLKSEIMRMVGEKIKESSKGQDKTIHEIRELVLEKAQQIEDLSTETSTFHKEFNLKHEKMVKALRENQTHADHSLNTLGDTLRTELDLAKKRLQAEIKQESLNKNFITQEDLTSELKEFELKLEKLEAQIQDQQHTHTKQQPPKHEIQEILNQKLEELQACLEEQIGQVSTELVQSIEKQAQQEQLARATQEACLQLKSSFASTKAAQEEKLNILEAKVQDIEFTMEGISSQVQDGQTGKQQDPQVIVDSVLEQIQPDIENLNEISKQLCQQLEAQKQQLQSRILRSELQEIKQDIDDEISGLEKLIKERITASDVAVQGNKHELHAGLEAIGRSLDSLEQQVANNKAQGDSKISHVTHDMQSKTEDLYEEMKELQEQVQALSNNQQPATPRSESTPERKSRLEAIASLKATLDGQISELSGKVAQLESEVQSLPQEYLSQDLVSQVIESSLRSVKEVISQNNAASSKQLGDVRAQLEEALDETHTKLNEHDARLNQLEEKNLDSKPRVAAEKSETQDYTNQIEDLHSQFVDLKVQVEENTENITQCQEIQGKCQQFIDELSSRFGKYQTVMKEEIEQMSSEVATQRELNACLQDVAVTQEDYSQTKAQLSAQLQDLEKKNEVLMKELDELKQIISTLQSIPQTQTLNENVNKQISAIETRLAQLESHPRDHVVQRMLDVASPVLQQQRRDLGQSANVEDHQKNHGGHFLEDLSEVISSPNNFANQTQGNDDMQLFNNRSNQSIGRNSIMSNRLANLVSPIGDRQANFQFNSQLAGQRLNLDQQVTSPGNDEEEVKEESEKDQQELPRSAQSQEDKTSNSHYDEGQANQYDDGGFVTESPEKEPPKQRQLNDESSSQKESVNDEQLQEDDEGDAPVQEINISLESAKEEETEILQVVTQRKSTPSTGGKRAIPPLPTSSHKQSLIEDEEVEEESKSLTHQLSNRNVEEVLEDLIDAEDEMFDRQEEDEESQEEKIQTPAQNVEPDQDDETLAVNLMSPASQVQQNPPSSQSHHVGPNHQHQANHFVAFESDEEDSQQYDLVPINNAGSRNAAGPHGSSQGPQGSVPPGAHPVVRNRYYESGSGEDEVDQPLINPDEDEGQNNAQDIDNFHVEFRDSAPVRSASQVDQAQDRLIHSSSPQVEEEDEKDAEFDDSPFDAASSQRFDQRFEDEGDVRRPVTSLNRNQREQENQDDPDFQAIQHETLSSHRSSELSDRQPANQSRRSISPNLEHQNNNIDPEEEEEAKELTASQPALENTQELNQLVEDEETIENQVSVLKGFPAEESQIIKPNENASESDRDEIQEEDDKSLSQRDEEPDQVQVKPDEDDWNLEDVTASQRIDNLDDEYDLEEEEKETSNDGPTLDNHIKSEQVANWIVENELNTCIQALLNLRNLHKQSQGLLTPIKGGDLLDLEDSSEWR